MDAANTHTLRKTALFLTIALLLAAPFAAQAQTPTAFVFPNGPTATINGFTYGSTEVDSNGSAITYSASQVRVAGDPILDFQPSSSGLTTGGLLYIGIANTGGTTPGSHTITVNLTSSSPAGINGTITVVWNPQGSGGGGGGVGATVSPTSLSLISSSGSAGSNTFTLTDTAGGQVNYSVSISYASGSGWLTVSPVSGYLLTTNYQQQFQVTAQPTNLSNNTTYSATITIALTGAGNGSVTVPVTFAVGTGTSNGNLTANPNPVNLNYVSGSNNPPSQFVTLTSNAGATQYGATITSGSSFLILNGSQSQIGQNSASISGGITIGTILGNLPTANQTGTVVVTDNLSNSVTITVNFTINGNNTNGLTLSPSPLTLNAAVGQTTQAQGTVTISSTNSGTLSVSYSGTGITAQLSNSSINAGSNQFVTVYANPTGLSANTYNGSITVTLNGNTSTSINVNFVVGSGSGGGGTTGGSVAPTSLQFNYETGFPQSGSSSSLVPQFITDSVSGSYTTLVTSGNSWLSVTPSGSGPGLITVQANPGGLTTGTNSGSFTVTTPAGQTTVTVTLFISSGTVVFANPPVLNIPYTAGQANPVTTFQTIASDSSAATVSAASNQSWLTVTPLNANNGISATPASFALTISASGLPNGLNVANVTVSSSASNSSLTVPVVVSVTGSTGTGGSGTPLLTLGNSSLTFTATSGSSVPNSQALSVTAASGTSTPYTASVSTATGGSWLSISPSGGLNTASTSSLQVSANQAGLSAGTYTGTISLATSSGTQTVNVTLVVNSSSGGGGGNITVSPNSMTFNYTQQGTVPGGQGFNVNSSSGSSISYSVGVTTASGGNWLTTSITSGITGQAVNVQLVSGVVTSLAAGTYTGTVTVTPSGGSPATVAVTLVVQGLPTVTASPSTLSLTYQAGAGNTPTATIQVSGSAPNLTFTANASSSGFLTVTPTSGSTGNNGATLTVGINPAGLAAGNYSGTIVVTGTGGATGSSTTTVTLTVTAPLPTISAIVNAASGSAGPVSPGEIVSIFGPASNPIGPSTTATLTLDASGNVATTLGGVQVFFNGIAAPLIAVSSTQINAVVPYGIAGQFAPFAQVRYLNQSSNSFSLTTTATAPGLFTQNQSGSGPGAILNQDNSVNGPGRPATRGQVIVIYMTGEGSTSPAGVTGKVTCTTCTVAQLPVPLLPVTVTFIDSNNNRYPANFIYAGEAPGFVSGLMQVDAVVPTTVPAGTLQVVVGVGSNTSQAGVTVSVQ